jgi:anthranilate synthase component 2
MARLLLIDNYDSFTFNLAQGLAAVGASVEVVRNDVLTTAAILDLRAGRAGGFSGLVLSPGPGRPEAAGVCRELLAALSSAPDWPVLGVCLGHQLIGQAFGATVTRAATPIHGKIWSIVREPTALSDPLWSGLPPVIAATRYHSLVVAPETLPDCLQITARATAPPSDSGAADDGAIMALRHRTRPLFGLQFHPESIGTPHGATLLRNFVNLCV